MGDIGGDRLDQRLGLVGLADFDAPVPRVLEKAIGAPVVAEFDKADLIDEQPRALARRHRRVEHVAVVGQLRQHRIELLAQNFQPGDLGLSQILDDAGLRGVVDPSAAQRHREAVDALFEILRGARRARQAPPTGSGFPFTAPIRGVSKGDTPSRPVSSMSATFVYSQNTRELTLFSL